MTTEEQIQKILEIESKMAKKQTSVFSTHTLMPFGLVLTIIGFSFAIGMNFQAADQTRKDLESFKKEYKDNQIEMRADIKSIQADIRVLLVNQGSPSSKNL